MEKPSANSCLETKEFARDKGFSIRKHGDGFINPHVEFMWKFEYQKNPLEKPPLVESPSFE